MVANDSVPAPGAPPGQPLLRKVALEEHFGHPLVLNPEGGDIDVAAQAAKEGLSTDQFERMWHRLTEFEDQRLGHMDDAAIDVSILSLNAPGIQGLPDAATATSVARQVNDYLAQEVISKHPERYAGFASIALQDAEEAANELKRCVQQLDFKGAMVSGYQNVDAMDKGEYLDLPKFRPLWEAVTELNVPVYLHPRPALPPVHSLDNHQELQGATWGFAPETATHALRLVYSGLFDRFPEAQVILGHLGEGLPFLAWRIQHCFEYNPFDKKVQRRLQDYLSDNFYVTTSGNFNDQALITALLTVGADRILFSIDYPYEMMSQAARWIEGAPIAESDRRKIAHENSRHLFRL